jgi:hypothetical protein
MKILIKLITISFILSSCAVTNSHQLSDLMQKRAYVELDISDIIYLGETEVSYEYSKYLFVATRVISINEESPNNSEKHYVNLQTSGFSSLFEPNMKRALYKAYLEFPSADYLEVTVKNTETHKMFLGRKIKKSATVKAYKYKYATK